MKLKGWMVKKVNGTGDPGRARAAVASRRATSRAMSAIEQRRGARECRMTSRTWALIVP